LTIALPMGLILYVIISAPARIYNYHRKRYVKFYPLSLFLALFLVLITAFEKSEKWELIGVLLGVIILFIFVYIREKKL
ncbi:MAG: hypothetical protein D6813_00005, partial [Calditrichaeota bacterium]